MHPHLFLSPTENALHPLPLSSIACAGAEDECKDIWKLPWKGYIWAQLPFYLLSFLPRARLAQRNNNGSTTPSFPAHPPKPPAGQRAARLLAEDCTSAHAPLLPGFCPQMPEPSARCLALATLLASASRWHPQLSDGKSGPPRLPPLQVTPSRVSWGPQCGELPRGVISKPPRRSTGWEERKRSEETRVCAQDWRLQHGELLSLMRKLRTNSLNG